MSSQNGNNLVDFTDLVDLALEGKESARDALKKTAHYLGIGIANLIQGLAPETVIIGGPIVRAWSVFAEELKASVEASSCRGLASPPIIGSTLGRQPTLMGALSLVLASKFASVP
jgi:predicted NBD/HSP70 family sugar kinase